MSDQNNEWKRLAQQLSQNCDNLMEIIKQLESNAEKLEARNEELVNMLNDSIRSHQDTLDRHRRSFLSGR